jgi:DNA-binding response OmpR family regulator
MKIHLKTMGETLFSSMQAALRSDVATSASAAGSEKYEWLMSDLPRGFVATDWVCQQETPTVLLVDGDDNALLRNVQASQGSLNHLVNGTRHPTFVRCPVILIFSEPAILSQWAPLPDFASDWILASGLSDEAVPRIVGALRRSNVLPLTQHNAALTLVPATRTMIYENASARLTPAEYTLLELFLNNIGSIISLQELVQTFRASGKSSEANNIRVAIYQLRLKLDTLTKSQMPLTSIYRQGYCLRQKLKGKPLHIPMSTIGNRFGAQSSA